MLSSKGSESIDNLCLYQRCKGGYVCNCVCVGFKKKKTDKVLGFHSHLGGSINVNNRQYLHRQKHVLFGFYAGDHISL